MVVPLAIVKKYLGDAVEVPVHLKVPREPKGLFVRVDAGAPQRINLAQYQTTVIVQVYGSGVDQVLPIIHKCQRAMERIDEVEPYVSGWDELSGAVEFNDPDTSKYTRWQFVGHLYTTM